MCHSFYQPFISIAHRESTRHLLCLNTLQSDSMQVYRAGDTLRWLYAFRVDMALQFACCLRIDGGYLLCTYSFDVEWRFERIRFLPFLLSTIGNQFFF